MKTKYSYIAFLLTGALVGLTGCQDIVTYNDKYDDGMQSNGAPVIHGIYDIQDPETSVQQGSLKQMLKLSGENLSNVRKVMFNDVEVPLSDIYATAQASYLPIPRVIPGEINNKMYYETKLGNTTIDFEVTIPKLKIEGLYNEFALPGDTVQVLGDFFDLYGFGTSDESTITMNGVALHIDSLTTSYLSVIIPEDASDNGEILFECPGTDGGNMQKRIPYRRTADVFWNLSDPGSCGLWAGLEYLTDGSGETDPKALYGPYFRVKGSFGAWSWNNLPCGGFNMPEDAAASPQDYYLVFEVNSASKTPFYDSRDWGYLIQMNGGSYAWNPSAEMSFNTYGKWRTIKIDLNTVATGGIGGAGWTNLFLILQPNNEWTIDHSFANYRIQRK